MMNSRQINFYLTPDDFKDIEKYIKDNNLLLIGQPTPDKKPLFVESLLSEFSGTQKLRGHKYIVRPEDLDSIIYSYIEKPNHYVINSMNSPVIEIWCSDFRSDGKKIDRIYYIKDALQREPLATIPKSPEFLQMADDFFKWFRKHFKNAKLPEFKNDLVSLACAEWVKAGGVLIRN